MKKIICIFILGFLINCQSVTENESRPNIILILTDDQGWGDLSINGNQDLLTPNIDQLAFDGVRFDRFYVSPVCSPTRAEILTGRHHVRTGVYDVSKGGERIDLDEELISEVFKNNGYKTAAYGKWHNGMQAPYHPNTRGFDDFYGFCSGHWGNYFNPLLEHNGELVRGEGFIIDDFTNRGLEFIEYNKENPFFLYLPFNTPHSPMQVPDKFWKKFEAKSLIQSGDSRIYNSSKDSGIDTINRLNHTRAALAMCENIDWNIGRINKKLKDLGILENTIIVFLSDNGPNGNRWNDGMKGIKGSTDEGGVRSPLIIKWEGNLPKGKIVKKISAAIDLLPTLKDLVNINDLPKNKLDGLSLKGLIYGEDIPTEDRTIFNYWRGRLSLRKQKFRLDHNDNLFDMENDPNQYEEVSNVFPEIFQSMKNEKIKWRQTVWNELPEKDERPFIIGHPKMLYTQIPARDANANGNIKRSNYYPNCSFMTNWIDINDSITWQVEVAEDGDFEVVIYYSCAEDAIGSQFELTFGESKVTGEIYNSHDPKEYGENQDRSPRIESYVKDFMPLNIGTIKLKKGVGTLKLKGIKKTGKELMDFRLLMLKRV
jgi:arylsulfatase A-like enzyme